MSSFYGNVSTTKKQQPTRELICKSKAELDEEITKFKRSHAMFNPRMVAYHADEEKAEYNVKFTIDSMD